MYNQNINNKNNLCLQLERWQCLAGVHARAAARGVEGDRLLAALLDLATLTRVLGRLAPALLQGEMYWGFIAVLVVM